MGLWAEEMARAMDHEWWWRKNLGEIRGIQKIKELVFWEREIRDLDLMHCLGYKTRGYRD